MAILEKMTIFVFRCLLRFPVVKSRAFALAQSLSEKWPTVSSNHSWREHLAYRTVSGIQDDLAKLFFLEQCPYCSWVSFDEHDRHNYCEQQLINSDPTGVEADIQDTS